MAITSSVIRRVIKIRTPEHIVYWQNSPITQNYTLFEDNVSPLGRLSRDLNNDIDLICEGAWAAARCHEEQRKWGWG